MESLQSSKKPKPHEKSAFSPFFETPLKFQGNPKYCHGTALYNQKHNLIIIFSSDHLIQFYDATTFRPRKGREALILDDAVFQEIASQPETDTYIIGCVSGHIYKYNASKNELKTLKECGGAVFRSIFLNPTFYCLLLIGEDSNQLSVRNVDDNNDNVFEFDLKSHGSSCLHHQSDKNLLFLGSGSDHNSMRIFRTSRLPHLQTLISRRVVDAGSGIEAIESVKINGKEYVVTASSDYAVRIWHLTKGKMRLLEVIRTKARPVSLVYLERYKMVAVSYEANYVNFLRLPLLQVEETLDVSEGKRHSLFLMKDKNMLGVVNMKEGLIEFIQLYHQEID